MRNTSELYFSAAAGTDAWRRRGEIELCENTKGVGLGEGRGKDVQLRPWSAGRPATEAAKFAQQTRFVLSYSIPSIAVGVHVTRGAEEVLLGEGMALVEPSMPKAVAIMASVFVCMVMMVNR